MFLRAVDVQGDDAVLGEAVDFHSGIDVPLEFEVTGRVLGAAVLGGTELGTSDPIILLQFLETAVCLWAG